MTYYEYVNSLSREARSLYDALGVSPIELFGEEEELTPEPEAKVVASRIRVQLNRPLTYAEKEELETNYSDPDLRRIRETAGDGFKLWVAPNREHVWVEAEFGSRIAFELVAAAVDGSFVNVYPKAVRTFREYNG